MGGAPGPKAEARRREVRVEERAQHLRDRLLDHPIDDGGNPQQPFPLPVPLRNLRTPDRGRLVRLVSDRLANTCPVFPRKGREVLNGHPVDAGCAVIGFHLAPGVAQVLWRKYSLHQIVTQGWVHGDTPRSRHLLRSVFVESAIPPPCPPCSVLHSRPWEQAESYYDVC